jgi:hypothetical protein
MKVLRFLPLLLILVDSCVEPFEIAQENFVEALVVDGMITNQPGPYRLTLKRAVGTNADLAEMPAVTGALITLHDDEGNLFPYNELAPGVYLTSNSVQGVVGKSYYVTISWKGKEYVSKPSTMMPAGVINDVYAQFEENVINFDDLRKPQDAIRVYFNSKGEPDFPNKFRWRWSGIYQVHTFPELAVRNGPRGSKIPDPLPCSGYKYNGMFQFVFPCECCNCYMPEFGQRVIVTENSFFNTSEFNNVLLATLPYEGKRFYYKYRIKMEQMSLDDDAYDYWRLAQAQQEASSDIFQPNTIRMTGNITCTTDPNERVLGLFYASGVAEKTYDLQRTLYNKLMDVDTFFTDCRQTYQGSTNIKPPLW